LVVDGTDFWTRRSTPPLAACQLVNEICMSTRRIVVDSQVADEFVKRFINRALPLGDHAKPAPVVLGSMVDQASSALCAD
jgi:benzaldehyde dehydrogenase (NAD)